MRIDQRPWWPELLSLKDTLSLRELGDRFGVTASGINLAFRRLGISKVPAPSGPRSARAKRAAAPVARAAKPARAVSVVSPPPLKQQAQNAPHGRGRPSRIEEHAELVVPPRAPYCRAG